MIDEPLAVFDCPLQGTRLVEASAGTGKTWNITGLYLRLLLELDLGVDGILVVTFTKKATAELRDRIRQRVVAVRDRLRDPAATTADPFVDGLLAALRARVAVDESSLLRRLDLATESFDEAAIYTIHGFCQRALADVPLSARMPLVVEQADDSALLLEVASDFWRRHVVATSPDVPQAAQAALGAWLAVRRDSPNGWAANLRQRLRRPLSRLEWPPDVTNEGPGLATLAADLDELVALFTAARRLWTAERSTIVRIVTDALPDLNANRYDPARVAAASDAWDRLFAIGDPVPAEKEIDCLDRFSIAKLEPKKNRSKPRPHPFFGLARSLLDARERFRITAETQRLGLMREFLGQAPAILARLKRERHQIAFDDMLWNLHERLASDDGRLARRLRERFPAALIDEFQDTDPLQYAIFDRIYGPSDSPLFFVGDPKQAIYGFRGADLPTYLAARDRAIARYSLDTNQRSTAPLLTALNALYERNQRSFILDGLDYRPVTVGTRPRPPFVDAPPPHRSAPDAWQPRSALQLWQLPEAEGAPMRKQAAAEAAARACAAEIVRLLEGGIAGRIRIGDRGLEGGNIAVLVPTHARGRLMRRMLTEVDVASVELSQDSVFASSDAEDLGRILAAIAQPARTGKILAALATDAMGHDAAQIAAIAADDERLGEAMVRFARYRDHWRERGIAALLRHWMRSESVAARLLARPDGERRLTNLMHLAETLQQASAEHEGLDALMRWFEGMRREHADAGEEAQLRLESDRHLVQIVTVHVAKGLEYPIVFCPFLWDGSMRTPPATVEGIECHDEDGQGVIAYRPLDASEKARRELAQTAERMRLLYVALTRAVHRCYLVVGCYCMGTNSRESCRSPLNWLVAGAGVDADAWFDTKSGAKSPVPGPAKIADAWAAFARSQSPDAVTLVALPQLPVRPLRARTFAPEAFAALPAPAWIPPARRIASYSSLITAGSNADAAARETDLFVDAAEPAPAGPMPADDDILRFPRGPAAGECLHTLFELVEFDDPTSWPSAIDRALAAYPQRLAAGSDGALLPRMLAKLLADVVATPLLPASNLRLAMVNRSQRLNELEFTLPVARLEPDAVVALMERHGYPAPLIGSAALEGYLRGFIDLVFEHEGRYYLADWKSNHLGRGRAAYGPGPLAQAMLAHDYHLQSLLYAVALDRHLRLRLPRYRYDDHFGGSFYLFVRGVRPDWVDAVGRPAGVAFDRPPAALIDGFSALLDRPDRSSRAAPPPPIGRDPGNQPDRDGRAGREART